MDRELGHVGDARNAEVCKVALLHDAVFQGDGIAWQTHRQAHQRRALHLGLNAARVDDQVAMDTGGHVVQYRATVLH
ncbi:hypothetical protein D3C86_2075400 [compost metagenome]